MDNFYVGLMSGTSLDAIDAVLIRTDNKGKIDVISWLNSPFPEHLPKQIRNLSNCKPASLHELCTLDTELGEVYAKVSLELIKKSSRDPQEVRAIGCHGQTILHHPDGKHPYSLQIGNPSVIAELTHITTISDFRSRDIAAGGQGAPLVPAFHQAVFSDQDKPRVITNIGGIANITLLPATNSADVISGYDTGPGNCLLDAWSISCRGKNFDEDGAWAASGSVDEKLLDALLADSYFCKSPPKSTGTDYFNLEWLETTYPLVTELKAEDVQATLSELTAHTIALPIIREGYDGNEVFLCGGGVHNKDLYRRVQRHLTKTKLDTTDKLGLNPDFVEATAFAWLARCTMERQTGNLTSVTGARHPVILGGIYPA